MYYELNFEAEAESHNVIEGENMKTKGCGKQVFLSHAVIEKLDRIREKDTLSYTQAVEKIFRLLKERQEKIEKFEETYE